MSILISTWRKNIPISGHTKNNVNVNMDAEGYIEQIFTLNAHGGLAVAGHIVCHIVPATFSFNAVNHVQGEVDRFLDNFVINDIPLLQRGGRLRPIFVLIGSRIPLARITYWYSLSFDNGSR